MPHIWILIGYYQFEYKHYAMHISHSDFFQSTLCVAEKRLIRPLLSVIRWDRYDDVLYKINRCSSVATKFKNYKKRCQWMTTKKRYFNIVNQNTISLMGLPSRCCFRNKVTVPIRVHIYAFWLSYIFPFFYHHSQSYRRNIHILRTS